METTINNGIEYTYNQVELRKVINNTIDKIKNIIKENDYQVVGNIEQYYNLEFKNLSKNQMKNIQKYCFWINRKPTLKKMNSFLNVLSRYYELNKVHIKVSLKEQKIQNTRKEWLKARNEADRLQEIYKKEKGDYYKIRLIFKK